MKGNWRYFASNSMLIIYHPKQQFLGGGKGACSHSCWIEEQVLDPIPVLWYTVCSRLPLSIGFFSSSPFVKEMETRLIETQI